MSTDNKALSVVTQTARTSRESILNKLGIVDNGEALAKQIKGHFVAVYQMTNKEANEEYLNVMRAEKANIAGHIDLVTQAGWIAEERWGKETKTGVKKLYVTFSEVAQAKVKPLTKAQITMLQKAGALTSAQYDNLKKNGMIVEDKPREAEAAPVAETQALPEPAAV